MSARLARLADAYDALERECKELAGMVCKAADAGPVCTEAKYLVDTARRLYEQLPYYPDRAPDQRVEALLAADLLLVDVAPAMVYLDFLNAHHVRFLRGELTGTQIVKMAGPEAWVRYNHHFIGTAVLAELVSDAVRLLLAGRKVLELGGGTGGTTNRLIKELGQCESFTFSDVKPGFLRQAAADLKRCHAFHEGMATELIDLNKLTEPTARFDLIYATNVMHVAHDVVEALSWCSDSLVDGGRLVIGEGAPYSPEKLWPLDLIFALFPGWWDIPMAARMRSRPGFMTAAGWKLAAEKAGLRLKLEVNLSDARRAFGNLLIWEV